MCRQTLLLISFFVCFLTDAAAQSKIYYGDPTAKTLESVNIDGDSSLAIVSGTPDQPYSVDVGAGKICWSDFSLGEVNCSNLDGSGLVNIVTLVIAIPLKVEIDEINNQVYWSESNFFVADKIRRADFSGTTIVDVVTPLITDPLDSFAVDAAGGKIYYAKGTTTLADIYSANLDGSAETGIISGVVDIGDIELDRVSGKIYWHDELDASNKRLRRANFDGTGVETLFSSLANPAGEIEVEPGGGKVYWADRDSVSPAIMRAKLDGSNLTELFPTSTIISVRGFGLALQPGPEINVKGNGLIIASGDTSPQVSDNTDFGGADISTGLLSKMFTINNCGDSNLNLTGDPVVSLTGANPLDFRVSLSPSTPIGAGSGSVNLSIEFDPSGPGLSSATVNIASDDSDEASYTFTIEGTGTGALAPEIAILGAGIHILSGDISPAVVDKTDFGQALMGAGSVEHSFSLENLGGQDLNLTASPTVSIGGANASDFVVTGFPTNPAPALLPNNFTIEFTPSQLGLRTAIVTIASDDGNENPYTFSIQGTGSNTVSLPEIELSGLGSEIVSGDSSPVVADGTDFGTASIGSSGGSSSFVVKNLGTGALSLSGVSLSGSSDFSVSLSPSGSVLPGEQTSFSILYTPTVLGVSTAVVSIQNNDGNENPYFFTVRARAEEQDTDNDGLSDSDEIACGTNPNLNDTDGDGVSDGQEKLDGSDPLDNSSFVFRLEKEFCADWNGFIGMTFNISEFGNFTSQPRSLESMLFQNDGTPQGSNNFQVLAGAQTDLGLHDMAGWSTDAIGTVCSSLLDPGGSDGDIDGRVLMYRPDGAGSFDFVLVMPFSNPLAGPVFVQFNTFHPSLDPAEFGFFAANWFTVANSENSVQTGRVIIYADDGSILQDNAASLPPDGRQDFSIHEFGANRVGLLEWRPDDSSAKFRVTLNRYVYGGNSPVSAVKEAVSMPAVRGSLQSLIAPVDTRDLTAVLEISNSSSSVANINIAVDNSSGENVLNTFLPLAPKATQHFVLDGLLEDDLGVARVTETTGAEIIVNAMQYGRNSTAGISNMYSIPAREALGIVMQGTYNTFINQGCSLLLGNLSAMDENVTVDVTRFDGTAALSGQALIVPANGVLEFDVCSAEIPNVYGVVRVQSTNPNTIVGNIVRLGLNDNYRIATPVR